MLESTHQRKRSAGFEPRRHRATVVLASKSPPGAALRLARGLFSPTGVQPVGFLWPARPRSGEGRGPPEKRVALPVAIEAIADMERPHGFGRK
jgi:hypothetical protein